MTGDPAATPCTRPSPGQRNRRHQALGQPPARCSSGPGSNRPPRVVESNWGRGWAAEGAGGRVTDNWQLLIAYVRLHYSNCFCVVQKQRSGEMGRSLAACATPRGCSAARQAGPTALQTPVLILGNGSVRASHTSHAAPAPVPDRAPSRCSHGARLRPAAASCGRPRHTAALSTHGVRWQRSKFSHSAARLAATPCRQTATKASHRPPPASCQPPT